MDWYMKNGAALKACFECRDSCQHVRKLCQIRYECSSANQSIPEKAGEKKETCRDQCPIEAKPHTEPDDC